MISALIAHSQYLRRSPTLTLLYTLISTFSAMTNTRKHISSDIRVYYSTSVTAITNVDWLPDIPFTYSVPPHVAVHVPLVGSMCHICITF